MSAAPEKPPASKFPVIVQMLVLGGLNIYYGFTRGYQCGDSKVEASTSLTLWAVWWILAASTKDPQFVRRSLKLALVVVLPATFHGMYRAHTVTAFLFSLLVALAALLSAVGYALALPKQRA